MQYNNILALLKKELKKIINGKDIKMLNGDEIKRVIESLPEKDFVQLRHWFSKKDWQKWDKQINADSEAGKLDFLVRKFK